MSSEDIESSGDAVEDSGVEEQSFLSGLGGGLFENLFDKSFFDDKLGELAVSDPDRVEAILSEWNKDVEDYVDQERNISLDTLRRELNVEEKISMLISLWLEDLFGEAVDERVPDGLSVSRKTFDEELKHLKKNSDKAYVHNHNIIYPSGTPLDSIGSVWSVLNRFTNPASYIEIGSPLVTGSRIMIGKSDESAGVSFMPTSFSKYKKALEKVGVRLTLMSDRETIEAPDEDEIQLVYIPDKGLPMGGEAVDIDKLKWYRDLYKVGNNIWFMSSDLLAAVYMIQGEGRSEAFNKAKLGRLGDANVKSQFDSLEEQLPGTDEKKRSGEGSSDEGDDKDRNNEGRE